MSDSFDLHGQVDETGMAERDYLDLLSQIITKGDLIPNRTGISAYTYPHAMLRFDMAEGFPLLTTKKMAWKSIRVELEFFIKGLTDKRWLQERGCTIWDEWCNPAKVPSNLVGEDRKSFQKSHHDLGKVYGYQWRNFNSAASDDQFPNGRCDQLKHTVDQLKANPTNRQLVVSAWNPCQIDEQALPPCHVMWHVGVRGKKLDLCWFQRSVDTFLGLPFNIASYGLLLHLLCKETGYDAGVLTGFLSNVHVYENHVNAARQQLTKEPFPSPVVSTPKFTSIFDWEYNDTVVSGYESHGPIKAEIAV